MLDQELRELIDRRINECLAGVHPTLSKASKHLINAGGKRIRPLICLLACEAVGGKAADILDTAVAVEFVHTFTLIHDDILDEDELRRGVRAVHVAYGSPTAILAGDILFSKAFELCDPRVTRVLAFAASDICEGQQLDLEFEKREWVDEKAYLEMISKKTASLFRASAVIGSTLGNGGCEAISALGDYGYYLGLAFQIRDDMLSIVGDERFGKRIGNDLVRGKKSLPVIKTMSALSWEGREELKRLLKRGGIEKVIEFIKSCGAIEACAKEARNFVEKAVRALEGVELKEPARSSLTELVEFASVRRF